MLASLKTRLSQRLSHGTKNDVGSVVDFNRTGLCEVQEFLTFLFVGEGFTPSYRRLGRG